MEAREEEDLSALLIPLVIVFYSSEDVLRDNSLGFFSRLWKYFVYRLIEIGFQSKYAHVQCYYHNESNYVSYSGPTAVYYAQWFRTPFTVSYVIQPVLRMPMLVHEPRVVSLVKNIKWWAFGGRVPVNCISDAEMILRYHCTKDSEHACKVRRYCRSVEQVEEAIRCYSFGFRNSWISLPDEYH